MSELWPGGPVELPHTFTIDDLTLTLPQLPTGKLLHITATRSWWQLLPNALPAEQGVALMQRVHDDDDFFDYEHLWQPATVLIGRIAGTATFDTAGYWPAVRLASSAVAQWPLFSAWCASHGMDPSTAALWRVTAASHAWLRDSCPSQDWPKLEQEIWAPPPHVPKTNVAAAELPRHVRDEEARLALASLQNAGPGDEVVREWSGSAAS